MSANGGPLDTASLRAEVERLSLEIQQYQAEGGEYAKGHQHGTQAAQQFRARAEKAESESSTLRARLAQLEAQAEQMRQALRAALVEIEDMAELDEKGALHNPGCIGVHGYDCKAWCTVKETLAALAPWVSGTEGGKR